VYRLDDPNEEPPEGGSEEPLTADEVEVAERDASSEGTETK